MRTCFNIFQLVNAFKMHVQPVLCVKSCGTDRAHKRSWFMSRIEMYFKNKVGDRDSTKKTTLKKVIDNLIY